MAIVSSLSERARSKSNSSSDLRATEPWMARIADVLCLKRRISNAIYARLLADAR